MNVSSSLHLLSVYETVFWFCIYGLIACLSVAGNLLVIYIFCLRIKIQTVTNCFVLNLALADMLTGLIAMPFKFQSARMQSWELPEFMCQLLPFMETVSLSVSVFNLTALAVDRFWAIMFPHKAKMTKTVARSACVSIWVFSILCSLPYGIFHRVNAYDPVTFGPVNETGDHLSHVHQCRPLYAGRTWWKAYNIYLTIVQYFVPVLIVDSIYFIIGYKVWVSDPIDQLIMTPKTTAFEKDKRSVLKMLVIITVVFTLFWLPYETYLLLCELWPMINEFYYINVAFFCFHWLAMCNSCLNPIIYGIYNQRIKRQYKHIIMAVRFCCRHQEEMIGIEEDYQPGTELSMTPSEKYALDKMRKLSVCQYMSCELGK